MGRGTGPSSKETGDRHPLILSETTMERREIKVKNTTASHSISLSELQYVLEGCENDFRIDGRSTSDIRSYSISSSSSASRSGGGGGETAAFLNLSNGCSRVFLPGGSTDVICSTKAEILRPTLLNPDQGILEIHVDYMGDSLGDGGGRSGGSGRGRQITSHKISQTLSKLILPNAIDLEALCIIPQKYCWKISIDLLILSQDGCVLDVCSYAIYKALNETYIPIVTPIVKAQQQQTNNTSSSSRNAKKNKDDFMIESSDLANAIKLEGSEDCPIILTICILQNSDRVGNKQYNTNTQNNNSSSILVMDARLEEELCASIKINVAVDRNGMICGLVNAAGMSSSISSCSESSDEKTTTSSKLLLHKGIPYRLLSNVTESAVNASKYVFENILCLDKNYGADDANVHPFLSEESYVDGRSNEFLQGHFAFR